jgi:hypothetical protein
MRLLKSGLISETDMHKAIIECIRLEPGIAPYIMHFPNEGKRSPRYGKLLKDLGMRPGVADLFIAIANHGYHGAWIELKTSNGRLSPAQSEFLKDMATQGYYTVVCRTVDDALQIIHWYCYP